MNDYLDILKEWEATVANPVIYEHIPEFFPAYGFVRAKAGTADDHWCSKLKLDLSMPRNPNKEKTVVYASDFAFREQGDWYNRIGVIDKVMEDYGLENVYIAYTFLAGRLGLSLPKVNGEAKAKQSKRQKLLDEMQKYFTWILQNSKGSTVSAIRRYLHEERGFSDSEIKEIGFGMVPAWEKVESNITQPRLGYTLEDLESACKVRNEEGFTNVGKEYVLSIPYRSGGVIKGFLFRSIRPDAHPKYIANTNLDRNTSFFNIKDDMSEKHLVIVEGEMDALTATARGIKDVVSIGGSYISGERKKMIYDALNKNTKSITLCLDLDVDKDGRPNYKQRFSYNKKSIFSILEIRPDMRDLYVVDFPSPTDPDEFIREKGIEAFKELLRDAKPWWNYLADELNTGR